MSQKTQKYPAWTPGQTDVQFRDGFLGGYIRKAREKVLPYQWEALNDRVEDAEPSHCIANFRAAGELLKTGKKPDSFEGKVFQDSDLAKWLEAAAYRLATHPDDALLHTVYEAVDLVVGAMEEDGYLQTYFTLSQPDKKWTNVRDLHEMYCAGHMMEAAVALFESIGERKLLDAMHRTAKHIRSLFGPEPDRKHGYPGHPEIELALIRMYGALDDPMLLELAAYFVTERGKSPSFFEQEADARGEAGTADGGRGARRPSGLASGFKDTHLYYQAHVPIKEQEGVEGHSVRALYLLAGVIDVAVLTGDKKLEEAAVRLFDNAVYKRMYVTGGFGSTHHGESFTFDYDLPNDLVYAETCASVAFIFTAQRMLRLKQNGYIADAMERAFYNTALAGMSLDGTRFFYVNPLQVWPEASEKGADFWHVLPTRPGWFGCACCPPNLARLLLSAGTYQYTLSTNQVAVQLYADSDATLDIGNGQKAKIGMNTRYPADGAVTLNVSGGSFSLALRIPGWCRSYTLSIDGAPVDTQPVNGYVTVNREWAGQTVQLILDMTAQRVYAGPQVPHDAGKVCIQRGPVVYALEEADNGRRLWNLSLPEDAVLEEHFASDLLEGVVAIRAGGTRRIDDDAGNLYRSSGRPARESVPMTFIPYYAWANRTVGEMLVWINES